MFACPHCNQLTISRRVKINISTGGHYNCISCGKAVGVPKVRAAIAWMPLMLQVFADRILAEYTGYSALVSVPVCVVTIIILIMYYVPIVKR